MQQSLSATEVRRYPAMATHAVPGFLWGGLIVGYIAFNHILGQVWNALPEIVFLGIMTFGLLWGFSTLRALSNRLIPRDDYAITAIVFSAIMMIVGTGGFWLAWCVSHPPPPPSCKNHEGFGERFSRDNDNRFPFFIRCNDGFTFWT